MPHIMFSRSEKYIRGAKKDTDKTANRQDIPDYFWYEKVLAFKFGHFKKFKQ